MSLSASTSSSTPSADHGLDELEPAPALVVNHRADLLAWTGSYERLAGPVGILDGDGPNLAWFTFADERARSAHPNWDEVADEQVANLHARRHGDPDVEAFAARLAAVAGAAFTDRWDRRLLGARGNGVTAMVHPDVGAVRLAFETLALPDPDRQWLVVFLPADAASAAALDRLAGRQPGALRSVSAG
ncbi:MAG: MmyB family transcriptional regulator [Acidimicrobiia bacterium]